MTVVAYAGEERPKAALDAIGRFGHVRQGSQGLDVCLHGREQSGVCRMSILRRAMAVPDEKLVVGAIVEIVLVAVLVLQGRQSSERAAALGYE